MDRGKEWVITTDAGDCAEQHQRHDQRGSYFGLAVPERMILVGGDGRHMQPAPGDERAEDVRHRLHGVGYQRAGIADQSGHELDAGEGGVDQTPWTDGRTGRARAARCMRTRTTA